MYDEPIVLTIVLYCECYHAAGGGGGGGVLKSSSYWPISGALGYAKDGDCFDTQRFQQSASMNLVPSMGIPGS